MPDSFIQLPADSTGKKLRSFQETVGANTVETQITDQREEPTFTAYALGVAPATNKSMFGLLNTSATNIIEIQELYVVPSGNATAITGVQVDLRLLRITGLSAGTAITVQSMDLNDAVPSGLTCVTGGTVAGEGATLYDRWIMWNDEDKQALDNTTHMRNMGQIIPLWAMTQRKTKSMVLRQNQGITVKCITNTTLSTFDVMIVFTSR